MRGAIEGFGLIFEVRKEISQMEGGVGTFKEVGFIA